MSGLNRSRLRPIVGAVMAALLAIAVGIALAPDRVEAAHIAARYTARVSFLFFIVTYLASSLVTLWPGERTRALLRDRRGWGLGFAAAHSLHLGALVTFMVLTGEPPNAVTLAGGGGAYLLMFVMAATSNDASVRALGAWWKRVHTVGIHWLWFVFTFTYFGRLFDPERFAQGAALLPVALAALLVRVLAWRKRRRTRGAAAIAG